ncbi:MAG TPA: leucyl aminopeptidase [Candidatus Diapherotrites archaeon]|uniref:Probable cytosol aminopeptidase n=1 Tax=Candidatus Iainarchaeum sp. TaxID=3101447 RepID=A0A7J4JKX7_9ARCH|nr:leucyl aminopeptidase [Candidatus Diapherotrites archaeon]HIH15916.1 leucyl aminopeptidase [Candidatus Diapherotrites archaeon]
MKLRLSTQTLSDPLSFKGDALVLGLFNDGKLSREADAIDVAVHGELKAALAKKEFTGDVSQAISVTTSGKFPFRRAVFVGLGDQAKCSLETLRRASAQATLSAKGLGYKAVGTTLHQCNVAGASTADRVRAVAEAAALSVYQFTQYKTLDLEKIKELDEVTLLLPHADAALKKAVEEASMVCDSVYLVRDLVNTPAASKRPADLAKRIAVEAKKVGVKAMVFDQKQITKMGMNGLLGVNKGSAHEPRFVVLEYRGAGAKKKVALVGKGITFDSGGINLKPWPAMRYMKEDMSGAATAAGTVLAAAKLGLPLHLLAVMAFTENMPAADASKPGDVVKALNGKTIEIIHTDAEGRVILADALSYAEKQKPDCIVDLATLTGAVVVALGSYYTGVMGNDQKLAEQLIQAGQATGEWVWQLPLPDEYKEWTKSEVADVGNISKVEGQAGAIIGAAFLSYFVEKTPWAHLDIAGTAFLEAPDQFRPYLQKGGTGCGVRLLIDWLKGQ